MLGDWNSSLGLLERQVDPDGDSHVLALPVEMQLLLVHPACLQHTTWGSKLHDLLSTTRLISTTARFGDIGQSSLHRS